MLAVGPVAPPCTPGTGAAHLAELIPGGEQCTRGQQQGRGDPLGTGTRHWGAASSHPQQPAASLRNLVAPAQRLLCPGHQHPSLLGKVVSPIRKDPCVVGDREGVDPEGGRGCLVSPLLIPVEAVASMLPSPSGHSPAPSVRLLPKRQLPWHWQAGSGVTHPVTCAAQMGPSQWDQLDLRTDLATGNQRDSPDVHRPDRPAACRPHPDCKGQVGASPTVCSSGPICPSQVRPGAARGGAVLGWGSWSHAVLSSVGGWLEGGKGTGALKARLQSLAFTCRW